MSQDKASSSTDRQARIRSAKTKRALFKLVMLIALLAILGVLGLKIKEKIDNQPAPNYLAELETAQPLPKRAPPFDPSKVDPAKLQPAGGTAVAMKPADSAPGGTAAPAPRTPKNFVDDGWGQETLKRAQAFYDDSNFIDAATVLQPVSQKAISPDLMNKLLDLRRRSEEYERACKHIQPLPMAREDNTLQLWQVAIRDTDYVFNVPKGKEQGDLFGEAIRAATPVSAGSMKLSFDPNDANVVAKKISRADLLQEFRDYFKKVEASSGLIADPNTCYDLVFLARRMALKAEALKYLEMADKMCRAMDAHIDIAFRNRCISLALDRAVFYDNLNQRGPAERILKEMVESLPDYERALAEANELREMFKKTESKKKISTVRLVAVTNTPPAPAKGNEEDEGELAVGEVTVTDNGGKTTTVETQPKTANKPADAPVGMAAASAARGNQDIAFDDIGGHTGAKAADKIAQADKLFREGIEHMRKGTNMHGGADDQNEIHKAGEALDKAADLYDAAADANKASNKDLADRLFARAAEAGQYAYGMHKRETLNFYPGPKKK